MEPHLLWQQALMLCILARLDQVTGRAEAADLAIDRAGMVLAARSGPEHSPDWSENCANWLRN